MEDFSREVEAALKLVKSGKAAGVATYIWHPTRVSQIPRVKR